MIDSNGDPILDMFGSVIYEGGEGNPIFDSQGNWILDINWGSVVTDLGSSTPTYETDDSTGITS